MGQPRFGAKVLLTSERTFRGENMQVIMVFENPPAFKAIIIIADTGVVRADDGAIMTADYFKN